MKTICFVCHGNICRSSTAEFIMKDRINKLGLNDSFISFSRGVSDEEEGNDIYPPAKKILDAHGIPYTRHFATQISDSDFDKSDVVFCMDQNNYNRLVRRFGQNDKIRLLNGEIDDPWYTGRFEEVYNQIEKGIDSYIKEALWIKNY